MSLHETAVAFFEACETGKGWAACQAYCHPDASFSCQSQALAETTTLADYAEWMKNLLTPIPDGHYVLTGFARDSDRRRRVSRHPDRRGRPGRPDGQSGGVGLRLCHAL